MRSDRSHRPPPAAACRQDENNSAPQEFDSNADFGFKPIDGADSFELVPQSERILHLSISDGPISNIALKPLEISFADLLERLSSPGIGAKEGSYFVRGPSSKHIRKDENIVFADCIVLDCDSRIDIETGEISIGAPEPHLVHDALIDMDVSHILFTTHSHGAKGHRYRVLIPAEISDTHCLAACIDHLIAEIHRRGIMLAPAIENYRWSQGWFLPRIASKDAPFIALSYDEGEPLDVEKIVRLHAKEQESTKTRCEAPEASKSPMNSNGPIGKYCAEQGGSEAVARLLTKHGYVLTGTDSLNGDIAFRFKRPGSSSGQAGVRLYQGRDDGRWLVFSHHGADDALADDKPHDAFDVFTILEHGGNRVAALQAISDKSKPDPDFAEPARGSDGKPKLIVHSAADLMAKKFAPIRWAVDGILPEGVALLAGSPKIGKSWVALDLCIAVASGGAAFGKIDGIEPGESLYLALEDNERRLQSRLQARLRGEAAPSTMFIRTAWPRSDQGGVSALHDWLTDHPACRLVVIDTLARFRKPSTGKGDSYSEDYEIGRPLLSLAAMHNVAIVLVHHTRKQDSDDPLQLISGTQGLTGGVDNILVLKRSRGTADAEMFVTGRDIPEETTYGMTWDQRLCQWILTGSGPEATLPTEQAKVLHVIKSSDGSIDGRSITSILNPGKAIARGCSEWGRIQKVLNRLREKGLIRNVKGGFEYVG